MVLWHFALKQYRYCEIRRSERSANEAIARRFPSAVVVGWLNAAVVTDFMIAGLTLVRSDEGKFGVHSSNEHADAMNLL